jgi:hypothetical protein
LLYIRGERGLYLSSPLFTLSFALLLFSPRYSFTLLLSVLCSVFSSPLFSSLFSLPVSQVSYGRSLVISLLQPTITLTVSTYSLFSHPISDLTVTHRTVRKGSLYPLSIRGSKRRKTHWKRTRRQLSGSMWDTPLSCCRYRGVYRLPKRQKAERQR